jgi:hypothetical protein
MNETLTNKLLDDFPRLFRHQNITAMDRGFECGDGWFELIYKLSQDIEAVALKGGLNPDTPEWPLCRQVTDKMGSLRFVVFAVAEHKEIYERIAELRLAALNQSLQVCAECGKHGELFTDGPIGTIATLCPDHARYAAAMLQTDSLPSRRISNFLDRPEAKGEKSKVFIFFYATEYLKSIDDAIDYLHTESPIPFLLRERERGENICVEVESLGNPKMVFSCSPPSGNPKGDLSEIIDWFDKSEIPVKLVS